MKKIPLQTYRDIVEGLSAGIRVVDVDGTIVYANRALCAMLGYEPPELAGKSIRELEPGQEPAGRTRREARCLSKAGQEVPVWLFDSPAPGEAGLCTLVLDARDSRKSEKTLRDQKAFFEEMVALSPEGIIAVNREGTVTIYNQAAEKLIGYRAEEVIGKANITEIYHPPELARQIKQKIYGPDLGGPGRLEGFETEVQALDGRKVPIRLSAILISRGAEEIGSVGFFHDLTAMREMEARLLELSVTDSLTGLYNHRHFHRLLAEEVSRAERYRRPLSLVFLDLDHFKDCNDQLGHLAGDRVLRLAGEILRRNTRTTDRAFRYGGDEFMLLLPETAARQAHLVAERVRKDFLRKWPFARRRGVNRVTLSLGVAQADPGEKASSLVRRADMAMYSAKNEGGNRTTDARQTA